MKLLRLMALLLTLACLPTFFKKEFRPPPVLPNIPPYNPDWDTKAPDKQLFSILNQPFFFLAKGNQASVFVSEDQKYVLKIFRYTRSRFPFVQKIKNAFKKTKKLGLKEKVQRTFEAAHLASSKAKEHTLCLYTHLNLSKNLLPKIELHHSSQKFFLPLDRYRFVLQTKVIPIKRALLLAKDHPEEMREILASFVDLVFKRSEKGIGNTDPNLGPNFGVFEKRAVEVDFGNYYQVSALEDDRLQEIENLFIRLRVWLSKNAPEYLEDLEDLRKKSQLL